MFRGLNRLRSGIKGHVGPTWIKKKNKINISKHGGQKQKHFFDFFSFYLFKSSFSDSRVSNRQNSSG